jgi:hypothetical protein
MDKNGTALFKAKYTDLEDTEVRVFDGALQNNESNVRDWIEASNGLDSIAIIDLDGTCVCV